MSNDDAFRWDGDDDPTLAVTPDADADAAEPSPEPDLAPQETDETTTEVAGTGNVALVAYGVLGGVYALWTVGWILGSGRVLDWIVAQPGSVPDPMYLASMVLAILAPAFWFGASLLLTRRKRAWLRFVALSIGALVLVPWPFVTVGVIG
ncbi:hypothetical protein GCM10010915_17030 [Microbacterium faecale]|uniref:DNA polymerase III subunit gamma/tau n=1 Tax=Microbacterium faecale TaxID=1804630 RepID=A0A916YB98_9MICO|nr:hypothetical protein [Microbacterium faecale]GGD36898.1 hypothetical protein GCM10010915_17030 [Microbacterium faecale]HJB64216.1 hypothetical protein [Candidatus Microbacterium pullistercoris]